MGDIEVQVACGELTICVEKIDCRKPVVRCGYRMRKRMPTVAPTEDMEPKVNCGQY